MLTVCGIAVSLQAQASPPPPVTDACSALRVVDFSYLTDGPKAMPMKVMASAMAIGQKLTPEQSKQVARRSRAMGASIDDNVEQLPDHCVVDGYVNPHIKFQLRLPTAQAWNGRFLLSACDGWCGRVSEDPTMVGVIRKYATMTTDGGHYGDHLFDGLWAMDNDQARVDFGYRANHVLLIAAKAIIKIYYGGEPKYSYITGCSKGGQAGVMAAARYPGDFDGVLARGPTINYTKVNVLRCGGSFKAAVDEDGKVRLGAEKAELIQMAVMERCDPKDGLRDGLISDPRKCDFDPASLQCGASDAGAHCLKETEVAALRELYQPIRDGSGKQIYPGVAPGSEARWPGGILPVAGNTKTFVSQCSGEYLKYLAFRKSPGHDYDWRKQFNWDRDKGQLSEMSPIYDADTPDLSGFRDAGGKLLVVHGWSDSEIPALASVEWYENVAAFMGGRDKVVDFARLFLLPGVNHCDGGVGPYHYDALTALESWVERGEAPQNIMTKRIVDGTVTRTRPAYPYPVETRYKGRGSIDEAASFAPHDPRRR
jgi:hypothetical protein